MKEIIIFMCLFIVILSLLFWRPVKIKDRIAIYGSDMTATDIFNEYEVEIHFYSRYNSHWTIEIEDKNGRILTAKDKHFAKAVNHLSKQIKLLDGKS